jgi:hypothetical protein
VGLTFGGTAENPVEESDPSMFSGYGIAIGFIALALLTIVVVGFIVRSAIQEVESRPDRSPKSDD